MAPSNAVHPKERRCKLGTECKKKKDMTKTSVTDDLTNKVLFLIGYLA